MATRKIAAIPGTMCDARLWEKIAEHLGDDLALAHVAVERCADLPSMQKQIAIAAQEGHLLGFSMGGYLALDYAVKHPQKLKSLIIMGSSAKGLTAAELQRRQQMVEMFEAAPNLRYNGMSRKQLQQFLGQEALQDDAITQLVLNMERGLGKEVFLTQLKVTSARENLMKSLCHITCPVLILGAYDDQKVPFYALEAMAEALPHATLVGITQSGHMLPLEQPQQVAEAIAAFYRDME